MRGFVLVASLVIVVAHGAARAVEPEPKPDYGRTGIYVGVAGTYANPRVDDVDYSLGVNARVGYRVIPRLGLEVQAEWAEGFQENFTGFGIEAQTWVVTANARAYFTEARIQPYLLVGFGLLTAEALDIIRETGFAARLGGGVDIGVTDRIAVVLEGTYVAATGSVGDLDYGSVVWGLQYRF